MLSGFCADKAYLDGQWAAAGWTAGGVPYYSHVNNSHTEDVAIYWDPDCDGSTGSSGTARWIIDDSIPSTTAASDLDGDQDCLYLARINSLDSSTPPRGTTTWQVFCTGSWESNAITIASMQPPSPPPQ